MNLRPSQINKLSWLIILSSICSISLWSILPINRYIEWIINFSILFYAYIFYKKAYATFGKNYSIIFLYMIWMLIGCIRGLFACEIYMDFRWLTEGFQMLSLPILVFLFSNPYINQKILKKWFKYGLIIFGIYIIWVINIGAYHFYLGPIYLMGIFIYVLPKKWQLLILCLLVIMTTDLGARAQVIKSIMTIILALCFMIHKIISTKLLIGIHYLFYGLTVILLYLGITGSYNIFQKMQENSGKYSQSRIVNGKRVEEDVSLDTRTFIYKEVIESAINHNYIPIGRTPARGNDEFYFEAVNKDKKGNVFRTNERHYNELCFPNIFTWLGIIGMLLYCLIYIKASTLALHKSNNIYLKYLAVFVSFRWMLGWIEDANTFNISNIALWMIIAMCFSPYFRKMNNYQFREWLKKCLPY